MTHGEIELRPWATAEVLTETEFHQKMAIRHTQEGDRHLTLGIEEYIVAGEHLIELKNLLDKGQFNRWVRGEYPRSLSQARRYMKLARHREEVMEAKGARARPLSLSGALKLLEAPEQEVAELEPELEPEVEPELEPEVEPEPEYGEEDGGRVYQAEVVDNGDREEEIARLKQEKRWAERERDEVSRRYRRVAREREREEEKATRAREELQRGNADLREEMQRNLREHLAQVYARYGIEEMPDVFDIPEGEWRAALEHTSSERQVEAGNILQDALRLSARMRQYEPAEAARAFLTWPSPERALEGLTQQLTWLTSCVEEMQALTTKGTLRAIGGYGNDE